MRARSRPSCLVLFGDISVRPPANRLEALSGNLEKQHSIRINNQWRICFEWREEGVYGVEIVDYH